MVHNAGALLYYDGANMNAVMGRVRPGDMNFDIVHLNLHKTFATPHGGGGPGSGPVGVKKKLEQFLPIPRVIKRGKEFLLDYNLPNSIGKIKEFYGNIEVCIRAYIYLLLMGGEGLREASEIAVLNSNYLKKKILDSGMYEMPYKDLRKHEFVLSCSHLKEKKGIGAKDIAKRLLDYGLHPPTIYFPLIVKEALMIEPTESETREDLDMYADALISIAKEDADSIKSSPSKTPVGRIDEVYAAKNPVLTWRDV
jgi:glycine dehydrogenase subunit 2